MKLLSVFNVLTVFFAFLVFSPDSNAVIRIQNCKSETTRQHIREAINLFVSNLDRIATEEFSFLKYSVDLDVVINDRIPLYVKDSDRFQVGLTDEEILRLKHVIYNDDVTIRCVGNGLTEKRLCQKAGGFAYTAHNPLDRILLNGGRKKEVTLCQADDSAWLGCQFYSSVIHELAHIAKIPTDKDHNNVRELSGESKRAFKMRDKVYMLDNALGNICDYEMYNMTKIQGADGRVFYLEGE